MNVTPVSRAASAPPDLDRVELTPDDVFEAARLLAAQRGVSFPAGKLREMRFRIRMGEPRAVVLYVEVDNPPPQYVEVGEVLPDPDMPYRMAYRVAGSHAPGTKLYIRKP